MQDSVYMKYYHLTLRFDNDEHSLTKNNGLGIDEVSNLFSALHKALNLDKNKKVVLSEIRGNCYATQITTESITTHEKLKLIHSKVSDNDYEGFTIDERKYAQTLKAVLGDNLNLSIYNDQKDFDVKVRDISMPDLPQYYYVIGSVEGVITGIGSKSLDRKSKIQINGNPFDISILPSQESKLIHYFKSGKLRFTVKEKIKFDTSKVLSAEIQSFEVLSDEDLFNNVRKIKHKYPNGLFPNLDDSVDYVRKIRD